MKILKKSIEVLKWNIKSIIQDKFGKYYGFDKYTNKFINEINLKKQEKQKGFKILIFTNACGSMFWVKYLKVISLILAKIGYNVIFIWNDDPIMNQNEISKNFRKWSSKWKLNKQLNYEMIIWSLDNIGQLDDVSSRNEIHLKIEKISELDTCQQTKMENYDTGNIEANVIYEYRKKINTLFYYKMNSFLNENKFDIIISVNGFVQEMAVLTELAKTKKINIVNLEIAEKTDSLVSNKNGPAWEFWREKKWEKNKGINSNEKNLAFFNHTTALRSSGKKEDKYSIAFQTNQKYIGKCLKNKININNNYDVVLMCTNLAWDSAVLQQGVAFKTQKEWIIETIKYFKNREHINLIIRIHPAEIIYGTNDSTLDCINKNFSGLPKNIFVINADSDINTYSIIDIANYGLVFSSSVGLEMVCSGIPVIVSAKVHYGDRGFTIYPKNSENYFEKLTAMISNNQPIVESKVINDALDYYWYYYNEEHVKTPLDWGNELDVESVNDNNWAIVTKFCNNLIGDNI